MELVVEILVNYIIGLDKRDQLLSLESIDLEYKYRKKSL